MEPDKAKIINDKEAAALLPDYFKGTVSEEDRRLIERWRAESDENRQKFNAVLELTMDLRAYEVLKGTDVKAALGRVNKRIKYKRHEWLRNVERVAAVLAIPLLAATIWLLTHTKMPEPVYCQLKVETGMIGRVVLPDSTVVILNSGSTLRYPSEFSCGSREVELLGEAYFDVKKDPERRFSVSVGDGSSVNVYGTRFNVEAYPDDDCVVSLVEGSIGFEYTDGDGSLHETQLMPNQQIIRSCNGDVRLLGIRSSDVTSWKDSKIILDNTPLTQILKTLERKFGVKFKISNSEIEEYTFSGGSISIRHIDYILETLKISSGIDWQYLTSPDDESVIIELSLLENRQDSK